MTKQTDFIPCGESPQAVAFALTQFIFRAEGKEPTSAEEIITMYNRCLMVTKGPKAESNIKGWDWSDFA